MGLVVTAALVVVDSKEPVVPSPLVAVPAAEDVGVPVPEELAGLDVPVPEDEGGTPLVEDAMGESLS